MIESAKSLVIKFTIFTSALLLFDCSYKKEERPAQGYEVVEFNSEIGPRNKILFDFDWRFYRGDIEDGANTKLDDSRWRHLDLPHDWSIEDIPGTDSPLDSNAVGGVSTGFFVGGTGWYRKYFKLTSDLKDKRIYLQFDGVYMNADIWLNEHHLGNHPYGYTTFGYDISKLVDFNIDNLLSVEVKNEGRNSRWYSGSGIYRHVWLILSEKIFIPNWGVFISTPEISDEEAEINVSVTVSNDTDGLENIIVLTTILDKGGIEKSYIQNTVSLKGHTTITLDQQCEIKDPNLWGIGSPYLYKAITKILKNEKVIDKAENTFGIRTVSFNVDQGFLLNGKTTLLKGGCMHHGNGPLGAAAFDRAEERQVELMKASGFNAIRCAHNPPSKAFLNTCDRLGIMVIDETFDMWRRMKNPQDYHLYFDDWWEKDVESMVLRDRNHPSIIMWSIGNEIPERSETEGVETSQTMVDFIRSMDSTRPITSAVNGLNPDKDPYFATLDVSGYNYAIGGDHRKINIYAKDHERVPGRIMYGAESYPSEAFGSWMAVVDYPYVIGDFVWTGFDYLGEASIGWMGYMQKKEFYPWSHAYCGDIDICGWKRPQSYYRDILWENGNKPFVFVVPPEPSFTLNPEKMEWSKWEWHDVVRSWNWEGYEGEDLEIHVYNRSESVELFLNEKSLGKKETNRQNKWIAEWTIPYEPGILKAVNYDQINPISSDEVYTAKSPVKIKLSADRINMYADGQDLCYIIVELLDENGIRNPTINQMVEFEIEGPGSILAVGSSNPMSTESYRKPYRKTYQGRCLLIVKSEKTPGNILIMAKSGNLPQANISINSLSL